jgi:opacity protein-like surface antigen
MSNAPVALKTSTLSLFLLLIAPPLSRADFSFAASTRYTMLRHAAPLTDITDHANSGVGNARADEPIGSNPLAGLSADGWSRADFDLTLGFGLSDKFILSLLVDFARFSRSHEDSGTTAPASQSGYMHFGVGLAAKYYFSLPEKGRISLYLYGDVFKLFATATEPVATTKSVDFAMSLASPFGFSIATGFEYFFTRSFSIGAELLGLRFTHASASANDQRDGAISHKVSLSTLNLYTALSLNFRVFGSAKIYEDGDRPSK